MLLLTAESVAKIDFDPTVTLSILMALCALFAPSITALINNCHHFNMRKLELSHEERIHFSDALYEKKWATYQKFIAIGSVYPYQESPWGNQDEVTNVIQSALLICDSETRPLLFELQKIIAGFDGFSKEQALDLITRITLSFSAELNSLSTEKHNKRK